MQTGSDQSGPAPSDQKAKQEATQQCQPKNADKPEPRPVTSRTHFRTFLRYRRLARGR
jgi:hypothetical protein